MPAVRTRAARDAEHAAALHASATIARQALRDVAAHREGQILLINGSAGEWGHLAVQVARILGESRVDAVCGTRNVDLVRSLGADTVIDYTRDNFTRL